MRLLWKIAAPVACVTLICGAGFAWHAYKAKAPERTLAEATRIKAERGDAAAQFDLGHMYFHGLGVSKDYTGALRWYRKSADQGNAKAQYAIGYMYQYGEGVPLGYADAANWYRKAADQGYAKAQVNLSSMYYFGQGVPQDYSQSLLLSHEAADGGNAMGEDALALLYYHGHGVPQDYTQAIRWYRKAADSGYAKAEYDLGYMYYHGQGVPQDYPEALRWLRKSADQGYAEAEDYVGLSYYYGHGVTPNRAEAYRWLRKAAAQGDEYALRALSEKLTPFRKFVFFVQIVGGLMLAFNFIPTNFLMRAQSLRWRQQRAASATGILCLIAAGFDWYGYTHYKIRCLACGPNAFTLCEWLLDALMLTALIYIVRFKPEEQRGDAADGGPSPA